MTDHGCQFRKTFRIAIETFGIQHVQGKVKHLEFNGKIEAFFKKLKRWYLVSVFFPKPEKIQPKLDVFREYYNCIDPMVVLLGRTPDEVWDNIPLPKARPYRQRDKIQPIISVVKEPFNDDFNLPQIKIQVTADLRLTA